MFLALRIIGAAVGVITAGNVAIGLMTDPVFVVPDYLIGAFLIVAALIPQRPLARGALIAGNAFALGVFSVALANRMQPGGVFNPALVILMAVIAASIVILIARKE